MPVLSRRDWSVKIVRVSILNDSADEIVRLQVPHCEEFANDDVREDDCRDDVLDEPVLRDELLKSIFVNFTGNLYLTGALYLLII